jgi:hypothetical protein
VLLASIGTWLSEHPAYADWGVAVGTILLAGATFYVARQARAEAQEVARETKEVARQAGISADQVQVSRDALEVQVRPVLIDVPPGSPAGGHLVQYEPGFSRSLPFEEVHVGESERGNFVCSVAVRNAGLGLAILKDDPRLEHPGRDTDFIGLFTSQLVPPGEVTRAYFGPGIPLHTAEDGALFVKVLYTDASGLAGFWTKLILEQRSHKWRVVMVWIGREGQDEPLVKSAAAV